MGRGSSKEGGAIFVPHGAVGEVYGGFAWANAAPEGSWVVVGIMQQACEVGLLEGGFLGVAEGHVLFLELAGEVRGGVGEGIVETAASSFAFGVKPGLVLVLVVWVA